MQERLKEIPKKLLEYWNKWTSKQKTIIIGVISAVIILIAILVFILGRTKYIAMAKYDSTKTASEVVGLLKDNSISTKLGSDNLTVMVDEERYADAIMAVATSDITDDGFGIDDLLNTSITTTNGERLLRTHLLTKEDLKRSILTQKGVVDVIINYFPKDTSNTILESSKEIPASIVLTVDDYFDKDTAEAVAVTVAYGIGNTSTDLIKVVDQYGRILFNGPDVEKEDEIDLTDKMSMLKYMQNGYIELVTGAILMNNFAEVNVAPNLEVNFDKVTELFTEYIPIDGENFGVLIEYHEKSSEGTDGNGGIPGTDSNDDAVDTYIQEGTGGNYETYEEDDYYQPSVKVKETVYDQGTINKETSSISVTATRPVERTEEQLEMLGLLDDMSFEEYILRNSDPVRIENDEGMIAVISAATGIPEENIEFRGYTVYTYVPRQEAVRDWTFYLQILLAVLLIAFLLFVVFRGMAPVEVTELEPELSIEQLLATTKENQSLEDVEFNEQSETRKMIEKFFEENPEAVAQLLRNWLNEEWN